MMSMFDDILSNLEAIAAKMGVPPETLNALAETVQEKIADGGDQLSALTETAKEHGLSLESLQGLMASGTEGAKGMLGKGWRRGE